MNIIIAGGGTGGHLFPGIALAQALKKRVPKTKILFLCTNRPFDARELTHYGFDHKILASPRLTWSPKLPIQLVRICLASLNILKIFKPSYIIGLGGYGSFGPLLAGKFLNIPLVLLEQNLLPGKVTRIFSAWARWVCCQWPGSVKYFSNPLRVRVTGSPLRQEIQQFDRISAVQKFGLSPDKKILTIIGGSQGAQSLNKFILDNLSFLEQFRDQLAIIHLTGLTDYQTLKQTYRNTSLEHYVIDFCKTMADVYSVTDLVISRAGGIAIAEMTTLRLPMIIVPYPYATENHQYLNAKELERVGVAVPIEEKSLSPEQLRFIIQDVLFNQPRLNTMGQASQKFSNLEGANKIVSLFTSLEAKNK